MLDAISLEDAGLYGVVVQGLEPTAAFVREQTLVEGRAFEPGDGRAVMLGQILARNLGKHAGDRVEIYQDEFFDVVGIYDRHNIFENGAMIVPLSQLQDLLGQRGQVTALNVTVRMPKDAATIGRVVSSIEGLGLGVSAMATEEYVATDAKIQGVIAMAWSTSAIALVIGAIGMLNTMIVSVFERTSEIGILRAIGWRKEPHRTYDSHGIRPVERGRRRVWHVACPAAYLRFKPSSGRERHGWRSELLRKLSPRGF